MLEKQIQKKLRKKFGIQILRNESGRYKTMGGHSRKLRQNIGSVFTRGKKGRHYRTATILLEPNYLSWCPAACLWKTQRWKDLTGWDGLCSARCCGRCGRSWNNRLSPSWLWSSRPTQPGQHPLLSPPSTSLWLRPHSGTSWIDM